MFLDMQCLCWCAVCCYRYVRAYAAALASGGPVHWPRYPLGWLHGNAEASGGLCLACYALCVIPCMLCLVLFSMAMNVCKQLPGLHAGKMGSGHLVLDVRLKGTVEYARQDARHAVHLHLHCHCAT